MDAPVPITPMDFNASNPLSNEKESNDKINFDKEKVADSTESLNNEIETLYKAWIKFNKRSADVSNAIVEVNNRVEEIIPAINDIITLTSENLDNNIQDFCKELAEKYSGTKFKKTRQKYNKTISAIQNNLHQIEIIPKVCLDSFYKKAKTEMEKLGSIEKDINSSCKELRDKFHTWYTAKNIKMQIPSSLDNNYLDDMQKQISDIKSKMSNFSYQLNKFLINHYYINGNKIMDEIRKIESFKGIIDNKELVKLDITKIKPHLLDIVNCIYGIKCFNFYYK